MKLITDSAAMLQNEKDIPMFPLHVIVDGEEYRDFETITDAQLLEKIKDGASVSTSQPSIGEKLEYYESVQEEEVIDITMAQGLSGTYDSALIARSSAPHPENIHVINSKTLCGPQQYLVQLAKKLMNEGKTVEEIKQMICNVADTDHSYLIPYDYEFLVRGGRISTLSAGIGSLLKLIPITRKREDGTVLDKLTVTRTWSRAVKKVIEDMQEGGVNENYLFYVCHAFFEERALQAKKIILDIFPQATVMILPLSPAFMVQGGPQCVSIQAICPMEKLS